MASNIFNLLSPLVNSLPEKKRISALYIYKFFRFPDLRNPKKFNDKVQWRKLNDRNSKYTEMVDKVAVKSYVKKMNDNVVVPKALWVGDSLKDIDVKSLPEKYVIKANHASGTNYIVKNNDHPSKELLARLEKEWRSVDVSKTFVEWAYSDIEIKFFVEEFLDIAESVPVDYKFWVFHGRVEFVQVDVDRFSGHKRAFFNREFDRLPFLLTFPDIDREVKPPSNFKEMVDAAEELSDGLDFIRVDLYSDGQDIFFGEFTMYPGGGYEAFEPSTADLEVGALWSLPKIQK